MPTPSPVPLSAIAEAATAALQEGRQRLATYVQLESPTGDAAALDALGQVIADNHEAAGGRVLSIQGSSGDHLISTWAGSERSSVCLLGHHDTVWPIGTLAERPYADDGTVATGPGVLDMKGGLVVVEMAMSVLAMLGERPRHDVRVLIIADEEIGSPDGKHVITEHAEGSTAVLGFEPGHPDGALKTGRRGSTRVALRVQGAEAHAALDPGKGVSAIDELIDQLADARAAAADGSTLFNIGRIEGGTRANVVPGAAWAEVGLRFTDPRAERRVLRAITEAAPHRAGAVVVAELLSSRPTWAAPPANPLLDDVVATAADLGQRIAGRPAAGAGDTNLTGAAGLPTLDGLGPVGSGAHAVDEHILVSSLAERAALLAAVLVRELPLGRRPRAG